MYHVKIINRELIADNTWSIKLSKPENFNFKAGQFVLLGLPGAANNISKPFSIASSPESEDLRFIYRSSGSDFKQALDNWTGDLEMRGPFGHLILLPAEQNEVVCLAAGVGIAPFLSYFDSVSASNKVKLFWSNQTLKTAPALDLVREKFKQNNWQLILNFTQKKENEYTYGRIDEKLLSSNLTAKLEIFYIVGGTEFVKAMKEILLKMGIKDELIKSEVFG